MKMDSATTSADGVSDRATRSDRAARLGKALERAGLFVSAHAIVVCLAIGVLLRVVRYLHPRSLWLDESYLTLNLTDRSYSDLVGKLDFNQGAPVLFLFLEKAMISVFGDGEYVLRFLPFVAGVVSLFLFLSVARSLLQPRAIVPALFLFATLEPFVYYSAEAKQYGFDVLIGLLLVLLATRALTAAPNGRTLLPLAIAGLVAPWLSHTSVFFLAGFGVVAAVLALRSRDVVSLAHQGIVYAVWLVSFGIEYAVSIRHLHQLEVTLTRSGAGSAHSSSVVKGLYTIFSDPGQLPRTIVGMTALLAAAGAVNIWRRRPEMIGMIAATSTLAVVAGLQHKYPIGQRFILFLLPLAVLLVAAGAVELVEALRRPLSLIVAAVIVLLVFAPAGVTAARHLVRPPNAEPMKPMLDYLATNWKRGDTLYLFQNSQYAFRYYLRCHDCNDSRQARERALWPFKTAHGTSQTAPAIVSRTPALVVGSGGDDLLRAFQNDLPKLRGRKRVWFLFTHYYPFAPNNFIEPLNRVGQPLAGVQKGVALLYLYDLSRPPSTPTP